MRCAFLDYHWEVAGRNNGLCTGGLDGWVDPGQYGIFYALDPDWYDVNGQRGYISALH